MAEGLPPIVITGSHRSGTTWLARLLMMSGELGYVNEPFNPASKPSWLGSNRPDSWYFSPQVDDEVWSHVDHAFGYRPPPRELARGNWVALRGVRLGMRAYFDRAKRKRVLVKDPFMVFVTDLLEDRYGAKILLSVRRPEAFVASIVRLNWTFDFANLVKQPHLLENQLAPWSTEIRLAASRPPSILDQGILIYRVIYGYLRTHGLDARHIVVRNEWLSLDVPKHLKQLYFLLNLRWSKRVEENLASFASGRSIDLVKLGSDEINRDSSLNVRAWSQILSDEDARRVRYGCAEEVEYWYAEGTSLW